MVRFCTNCGAVLPEGAAFCTACGAGPGEDRPGQDTVYPGAAGQGPSDAPAPGAGVPGAAPAGTAYPAAAARGEQKPVGTIAFMLLQLLYAIPVIGFFASLALAIAPENRNLKHHALASFIWRLVLLALLILGAYGMRAQLRETWDKLFQEIVIEDGYPMDSLQDILNDMGAE